MKSMKRMARAVLVCVGCAAAMVAGGLAQPVGGPLEPPANGPRRTDTGWSALVNATVHPRPGATIEHATVVMRDGKIAALLAPQAAAAAKPGEAVQPTSAPEPPPGAERWDATGLHVYAGLIDAFVEVDAPAPDPNAPGVHWNKRVTPQRSARDGTGVDARTARQLRELGFTAAAIAPKGGVFRGSGAVVSLAEPPAEASAARPPVYMDRAFNTVSFETVRGRGGSEGSVERWESYPDSQMGAIALIRQTLSDADWEATSRGTHLEVAPTCLNALGRGATDAQRAAGAPLLFDVSDELEVLRAIKIAREFGRGATVVGSGVEFRRLDAIQEATAGEAFNAPPPASRPERQPSSNDARRAISGTRVPLIVPLAFPEAPKVGSIGAAEEVPLRDLMTWEQAPANPQRLDAAGITVALTSSKIGASRRGGVDETIPPSMPPPPGVRGGRGGGTAGGGGGEGGRGKFRENLRTAIRYGLSEDRALAMLTTNPAEILGVSDQLGTIQNGKRANLVVADGPLFAKKTRLRAVWIDGRRHELNAAPSPLEGTWDVTLTPGPAKAGAIRYQIERDGSDLSVSILKTTEDGKEQKAKARQVKIDDAAGGPGRIAFVFDHEPFGQKGVFTISGVLEKSPTGAAGEMHGEGTRADGARFAWAATRAPSEPRPSGRGPNNPEDPAPKNATDDEANKNLAAKIPDHKGPHDGPKDDDTDEPAPTDIPQTIAYPFGPYASPTLPEQPDTILIHGCTIWTSGPAGKIDNGAIVIRKGKIEKVYDSVPVNFIPEGAVPPGTVVIDARGKHVTPGIIDCHSHTGISKGVNEAGQTVTAEVRIEDVTNPDAIAWYRELAGGTTTVNSLHGSANPIGGQNCINKIRWGVHSPDDMHMAGAMPGIKFALGENVKRSNSSEPGNRYPTTRMGVEAIIRDRFDAAREYAAQLAASAKGPGRITAVADGPDGSRVFTVPLKAGVPPRRDLELEALAEVLEGKRLVHCHSYRQDEILMLARLAHEFNFKLGTYQHCLEGYKVADEVGKAAIGASIFSDWWAYKVEVQDAIPAAGPIMHDAGVIVSYNSDSDELARRLNVEAGKAVKYGGLSPEEALKFVTINPAKQLMIDRQVGSLEPGKDADFVIWSGPPMSSLSRCEQTWIDGRQYFSLEKDKQLREADAASRQRIIQKILAEGARKKGRGGERGGKKEDGETPATKAPETPTDADDDVVLTSGRRSFLMVEMLRQARDRRRELFLDYVRRGLDPESARCGQCGEELN